MVSFERFSAGVTRYVVDEVIPHVVGGNPFLAGMAGHIIAERGPTMLKPALESPMLRMPGIVDGKGNVDIDLLYAATKKSMEENGEFTLDLPFGTIRLKAADIEKLNQFCRGGGETK